MNLMDDLIEVINSLDYESRGNRSFTKKIVLAAIKEDLLETALERVFKVLATTDLENAQAAAVARRCATSFANTMGITLWGPKATISAGIEILDWFARIGLIRAEKRKQIQDGPKGPKSVDVWFLKALAEFSADHEDSIFCDPRRPYVPWMGPTRFDSGTTIPIVKRADQLGLLDEYTPEKIPLLYAALNRIGNTVWEINMDLFAYAAEMDEDNSPLPKLPSQDEFKKAQNTLRNVKASKRWRMAAAKTIGAHEKRTAFEAIMEKAYEYQGSSLQYPHNLCGRGRIYSLSPILNPQGADIAKALLVLKDKVPLHREQFFIHTANCAGQDKIKYQDRVQWTHEHLDALIAIGRDPIGQWPMIQSLGVHKEKKTYYQFISCCIELSKWAADPEYKTGVMLGLDSTSSGNQILAMLARDHEVAEYVNISPTMDETPGDLYAYVGKFVKRGLEDITPAAVPIKMKQHVVMDNIAALAALPKGHKTFRKITKRICMVLPYSGTRYGAGEITKDDQFDHGCDVMNELNFADCSVVGAMIYDQCVAAAKRSMGLMEYMRDNLETNETTVTWRVPHTNFLAFQTKEKMTQSVVTGTIGKKQVNLQVFLPTGNANGAQHKNAISPGMVHSLDAAMLAMIINGIPVALPVSAIHDQFCVPMGHMDILVASARNAYASIADRDRFMDMAESCFGERVDLPEPGRWYLSDLQDSDYFIC